MSHINITFEEAVALSPEIVANLQSEAAKKLKRSKAKKKGKNVSELAWGISWCTEVSCGNPFDFGNRKEKTKIHATLCASMPGAAVDAALDFVPQQVADVLEYESNKQHQEEQRLAALSPEERAKEVADLVAQLTGMGGFRVVG